MKNFLMFVFFISIFIFSCKKDSTNYALNGYPGEITGLMFNDTAWVLPKGWYAQALGFVHYADPTCNINYGVIRIKSFTQDSYERELIGMAGIPFKTGKFIMTGIDTVACTTVPNASLALEAADGDAIAGLYDRLRSVESSITVASYDSISGDVKGTFDITFVKNTKNPDYYKNYSDTVRFNGGQFHTKWIK